MHGVTGWKTNYRRLITCALNRKHVRLAVFLVPVIAACVNSLVKMASPIVNCRLCGIPSPTLKLYISHLRTVHGKDPNFNVMCNIDGCREVFRTFSAFNSHVYRHHRMAVGLEKPVTVCDDESAARANDSSRMDTDLPEFGSPNETQQNLICGLKR